jgi:hypothetical protein
MLAEPATLITDPYHTLLKLTLLRIVYIFGKTMKNRKPRDLRDPEYLLIKNKGREGKMVENS